MASQETQKPAALDAAAKKELIEKAYTLAYKYEQSPGNCPQCVLAAVRETMGGVDEAVFKASHALAGGGVLSTEGTCGALAGALLALSNRYGRELPNFHKGRYLHNYQIAKIVFDKFVAEFGSPICARVQAKLMGRAFDMWDAADFKAFLEAGGHDDKCPLVAAKAAAWAVEVLLERGETPA